MQALSQGPSELQHLSVSKLLSPADIRLSADLRHHDEDDDELDGFDLPDGFAEEPENVLDFASRAAEYVAPTDPLGAMPSGRRSGSFHGDEAEDTAGDVGAEVPGSVAAGTILADTARPNSRASSQRSTASSPRPFPPHISTDSSQPAGGALSPAAPGRQLSSETASESPFSPVSATHSPRRVAKSRGGPVMYRQLDLAEDEMQLKDGEMGNVDLGGFEALKEGWWARTWKGWSQSLFPCF
ncbi:hypothetical protein BDK51DRAFT_29315 [Blyttiomyces helicus]|uniref:Uncharacterized protein n=1 Tax=Blyttiomyces helicus TaxID=388810 RepID=A0A4P9WAN5_9FUNG|nr:hypothetical protein BDK51DRAFT_29315 [Blyttiomyces helicus]|eukprot:RKO87306.1 hypothetical protein BDK51DRAFT_29315 [Blyttiomyces helicus]